MNLDDAQRQKVVGWIAAGANLATIQKQLTSELGVNLTYMQVRLLVDDLKLTPRDTERPRSLELGARPVAAATPGDTPPGGSPIGPAEPAEDLAPGAGKVSISVDQLARPGSIVSGKVTFSDGKSADWYLDQMGRLGLVPSEKGYKPSTPDVQAFQMQLQNELARMGY